MSKWLENILTIELYFLRKYQTAKRSSRLNNRDRSLWSDLGRASLTHGHIDTKEHVHVCLILAENQVLSAFIVIPSLRAPTVVCGA